MALRDFEAFLRDRLRTFSQDLDTSSGSPLDVQVIQPILRRIGTDPFTIDAASFILDRLAQQFPDLAQADTDAISDALVKPMLLLWDPILREIQRVKLMLSLKDPTVLTLDEADALGANLFSPRRLGKFSRGVVRMYFDRPRPVAVNSNNFFTSRSGLRFVPVGTQSIKSEEMLLNRDGGLYFFDTNVVAVLTGEGGDVGVGEIVSVANVSSAVRVTNRFKFQGGVSEETTDEYVGRLQRELSEKSLVTDRGIKAQIPVNFPSVTRVGVVGFRDEEMRRDVLTGGGVGEVKLQGLSGSAIGDGTLLATTKRFFASGAGFDSVGAVGEGKGWVLTVVAGFAGPPFIRDLMVERFVSEEILEVEEPVLVTGSTGLAWTLRKKELTISGIPGGFLFPDAQGNNVLPQDQVHVGGCVDVYTRSSAPEQRTLVIDQLSDEKPAEEGKLLNLTLGAPWVSLADRVLGTNYQLGDETYKTFEAAAREQFSLQILDGVAAGVYRVLDVIQMSGASPLLLLEPTPPVTAGAYRWRLLDVLEIDLVEPQVTRVRATSGQSFFGLPTFSTSEGLDFDALGVSPGDILRIENGFDRGDFVVQSVTAPLFTSLELDKPFLFSSANLSFRIFRPNAGGGVQRPVLRVKSVELLDATGQPTGTFIPYALPVLCRSRSFANVARGIKFGSQLCTLGMVSNVWNSGTRTFVGSLVLAWDTGIMSINVTGTHTRAALMSLINSVSLGAVGTMVVAEVTYGSNIYVGFLPVLPNLRVDAASTASVLNLLFGDTVLRSVRDVRAEDLADWSSLNIDFTLDVLTVLDGYQPGFFHMGSLNSNNSAVRLLETDLYPQVAKSVTVGSRSIGSARLYFTEPTSAEVDQDSLFYTLSSRGYLGFVPDPTLSRQIIPALPDGLKPLTASVAIGGLLTDTSQDFVKKGIHVGDEVVVDFTTVTGTAVLADPVPGAANLQLIFSISGGPDKTVTLVNDVGVAGAVSRQGVEDQINAVLGQKVVQVVDIGGSSYRLRILNDVGVILRNNSSPYSANTLLGFPSGTDTSNAAAVAGKYTVASLTTTTLQLNPPTVVAGTNLGYKVFRKGAQRISSTQMNEQKDQGFYYWDVELVSQGVGDVWNIDPDEELEVAGIRSDGYYLSTTDDRFSFSPGEQLSMHVSRSLLSIGVDDDLENATQLTGQRVQVTYDTLPVVEQIQNFLSSEGERVVCASPLSKHLVPHYVRLNITYVNGPTVSQALSELTEYVNDRQPDDALESSDIQGILTKRGATGVRNPLQLMALVMRPDRSVRLAISEDSLTTTRLAAFLVDNISLTRTNLPISTERPL